MWVHVGPHGQKKKKANNPNILSIRTIKERKKKAFKLSSCKKTKETLDLDYSGINKNISLIQPFHLSIYLGLYITTAIILFVLCHMNVYQYEVTTNILFYMGNCGYHIHHRNIQNYVATVFFFPTLLVYS